MEAIVRPVTWSEWPEAARSIIQNIRSPQGEELVLQKNLFLEGIFPASILRKLSPAEMEEYRRPFRRPGEDRRPTLTWPRDLPIEGQPPEVVQIVADYAAWLSQSQIPKLFFNAEPGGILIGPQREFCRAWPNQQEITIEGIHYIQEDAPHQIGRALAQWYQGL